MAWNFGFSAQFYDIEPLKYAAGDEMAKAVVIDANQITLNVDPNQRTVVPAGTVMRISTGNPKQVMPYNGTGTIVGILKRSVDILTAATKGCEPGAVYWHNAVFATQYVVGFTQYSANIIAALGGCKFE
jgi:hypothetical protein